MDLKKTHAYVLTGSAASKTGNYMYSLKRKNNSDTNNLPHLVQVQPALAQPALCRASQRDGHAHHLQTQLSPQRGNCVKSFSLRELCTNV